MPTSKVKKARKPASLAKSDGDAGVRDYIASMEPWQAAIARRVNALDEKQLASWIRQAASIPGWGSGPTRG